MPVSAALDRYVRNRQVELARRFKARKKVYLDTRFWIIVRNAVQDEQSTPAGRELLALLREGVATGRLICPISGSTFIEVLKQTNTQTRRVATAALIDELSLGLSLTPGRTRAATEIAHFFYAALGQAELYDLDELVWTRLSYALGYLHPTMAELDAATEFEVQQQVFDEIWDRSLSDIVATIGNAALPNDREVSVQAMAIDADIKLHQAGLVSYQQTYRNELVGAADNCCVFAVEALEALAERAGKTPVERGSPEWQELGGIARNLLVAAFSKPSTKLTLRYMHVQAAMHASLRWNKGTTFTANHLHDFEHASGALAYCDAFFTEGFLSNIANAGHAKLTELNGCTTTNSPEEAVKIIRKMSLGGEA